MLILRIFILLIFFIPSSTYAEYVTQVHDGDTFRIAGKNRSIRIWGIDAPEIGHPKSTRYAQPFAVDSRNYLREMILDKDVALDCSHGKSHQRPVCQVFIQGQDVAYNLVKQGLAYDEPRYSDGRYAPAQQQAQQLKKGVWQSSLTTLRPWEYRSQRYQRKNGSPPR